MVKMVIVAGGTISSLRIRRRQIPVGKTPGTLVPKVIHAFDFLVRRRRRRRSYETTEQALKTGLLQRV